MSSPTPDDYASLTAPWQPIAKLAMEKVMSLHTRVSFDHGTEEGDLAQNDSFSTVTGSGGDTQVGDTQKIRSGVLEANIYGAVKVANTDSITEDSVVGDNTQGYYNMEDSATPEVESTDFNDVIIDGAQIDRVEITDMDNDAPQHVDTKCVAVMTCVANSGDHRKVVSHIFGRNKACTRGLPNNLWIFWCRKHYQRMRYRAEDAENWHTIQLGLVRKQLQTFEDWGEVRFWTIALRKTEQEAITKENENGATYANQAAPCWERFLVPYLGSNKTFGQVRQVLDIIESKFNESDYRNREKKLKIFPGVEFLPGCQKAKEVKDKKPAGKRGEVTYKKITLDQPAFNRKTRVNQDIKEMAAKHGQVLNTPKGSDPAIKKETSPYIDNGSDTVSIKKREAATDTETETPIADDKRKSVDHTTVNITPRTLSPKRQSTSPVDSSDDIALPTKRRRLTRGYDKHGSDVEKNQLQPEQGEGKGYRE